MADTILRKKRPFVGRKDLIAAFKNAVKTKKPDKHKILVYHGVGGIGKTALRIELAKELEKIDSDAKWALLDFEVASYRDIETALFWLRQEFKSKYKIDFPTFDIGYAVYWKKIKPQIPLNQSSFPLWDETGLLADLIKDSGDIPVIGLIPKLIKVVDKADKYISDWFTKRGNALLDKLPLMEAKDIEKLIPMFLAEDLNNYTEEYGYKTAVFIDTYEQLWGNDRTEGERFTKDEWIRKFIEKTPRVVWVIGGREELEWPKLDKVWENRIEPHCVDDLDDKHANRYLKESGIDSEDIRNVIIEGSKGVPFYLDLSVDTYDEIKTKGKEPATGDFGKTARDVLDLFIRSMNENEIQTLNVLCAAQFWDEEIFVGLIKHFGTGYPLPKIREFHRFSFIKARPESRTWVMHDLMRDSLIEHSVEKESSAKANNWLFNHYKVQVGDIEPKDISESHKTAFREASFHAAQSLPPDELLGWFIKAADAFNRGAQWPLLTTLYEDIKANLQGKLGPDHLSVATTLNNLAGLYQFQGRYAEAEPLYKRSLEINEKALGPDHPSVATTLNNLAALYESQGRYAEAEPLYKRSIKITEKALGPDDPSVATTLNNLAFLYTSQGRYAEAEPLYKRSIKITEKALGPDHPDVAPTLDNLANLYTSQGGYIEAEPLYGKALEIKEKALGLDHPSVATTLNNLAELYRFQGKNSEAEPLYKRSLEITEKGLGPDHPEVASTLNNLALLYEAQGRYGETEPLYKRALKITEKVLGLDHPSVARMLNNLASLYRFQGRYADAEPLYKRSHEIRKEALGPDHPDVATTLNNLAGLYRSQGKQAEAEPRYKRALEILEKSIGPIHPNIATTLENMAGLYKEMGKKEEEKEHLARAKEIRSKLQE